MHSLCGELRKLLILNIVDCQGSFAACRYISVNFAVMPARLVLCPIQCGLWFLPGYRCRVGEPWLFSGDIGITRETGNAVSSSRSYTAESGQRLLLYIAFAMTPFQIVVLCT